MINILHYKKICTSFPSQSKAWYSILSVPLRVQTGTASQWARTLISSAIPSSLPQDLTHVIRLCLLIGNNLHPHIKNPFRKRQGGNTDVALGIHQWSILGLSSRRWPIWMNCSLLESKGKNVYVYPPYRQLEPSSSRFCLTCLTWA